MWDLFKRLIAGFEFLRFLEVGAVGFVINSGILSLLHGKLGLPLLPSSLVATEIALAIAFVLHHNWTYRSYAEKSLAVRFLEFNLTSLSGSFITIGCLWLLTNYLHWFYIAALAVGAIVAMAWNYFMNKFLIWRQGRSAGSN